MDYKNLNKKDLINLLMTKDEIINEMEVKLKKLEYYATIDEMTGVLNKRVGFDILRDMTSCVKNQKTSFTVCFLDVDGLKKINDCFGHLEGDRLLRGISEVVRSVIRKTDIISRVGGDEFIIIFPNTNLEEGIKILERINKKIDEVNRKDIFDYNMSISYGLMQYDEKSIKSIDDIIQEADFKMYNNKKSKQFA